MKLEISIAATNTKEERAVLKAQEKVQALKVKLAEAKQELQNAKTKASLAKKMAKKEADTFITKIPTPKPTPKPTTNPSSVPRRTSGVAFDTANPELKAAKTYDRSMRGKVWHDILNVNARSGVRQEGFWRSSIKERKSTYPFPIVYTPRGYNKKEFIERLEEVLSAARKKSERGISPHRWTGKPNGSFTYKIADNTDTGKRVYWSCPEGYITYVKAGVPPSRAFYKLIMGRDLASLPDYHQA